MYIINAADETIKLLRWRIKVFSLTINDMHHTFLSKADNNSSTHLTSMLLLIIIMSYWMERTLDFNHKKYMIDVDEKQDRILSYKILRPLVSTIKYIQPISSLKAHTNPTTSSSSILLLTITVSEWLAKCYSIFSCVSAEVSSTLVVLLLVVDLVYFSCWVYLPRYVVPVTTKAVALLNLLSVKRKPSTIMLVQM